MTIETTISYDTPADFTYDAAKIDVTTVAKLKLGNNPSQSFSQAFASDSGFVYDNTKAEFTGGVVQQKDQRPAGVMCGATYTTDINLNWGGGVLTGTAFGGAGVAGGKLVLTGGTKYVSYNPVGNANSYQTGCIRLRYTPNYSGTPAAISQMIMIAQSGSNATNMIDISHSSSGGNITATIFNSAGASLGNVSAVWSPVSGTEYEIEFNWDITTGASRLFIDGVQVGSTLAATGTRSGTIGTFYIGAYQSATRLANASFNDVEIFSTVQHTANYTPGYTVVETIYGNNSVTLPLFTYPGVGSLQAFSGFTTTEVGSPRYVLNGKYYSGGWIASDGSYAQASPKATILTNIATLPASSTLDIDLVFDNSTTIQSVSQLDATYTGQIYPTDNPKITVAVGLGMTALVDFDAVETKPAGSEIKYTGKYQSLEYYVAGGALALSNGTYAQASTKAELQAALAVGSLDISPDSTVQIIAHLNSNGTALPELTSVTLDYNFFAVNLGVDLCEVYGYIMDSETPIAGAVITFKSAPFFRDGNLISINKTADQNHANIRSPMPRKCNILRRPKELSSKKNLRGDWYRNSPLLSLY